MTMWTTDDFESVGDGNTYELSKDQYSVLCQLVWRTLDGTLKWIKCYNCTEYTTLYKGVNVYFRTNPSNQCISIILDKGITVTITKKYCDKQTKNRFDELTMHINKDENKRNACGVMNSLFGQLSTD